MRTHHWMPAAQAALTSKRADCGHDQVGQTVYLRVEKAGGTREIWTVCAGCQRPGDLRWMPGSGRPVRMP